MPITFYKYHGIGNDFIILPTDALPPPELATFLCNRHTGIGADGLLVILHTLPNPTLVIYNPDGSRPEMCANGLRCAAAYHFRHHPSPITFQTDAGPKTCTLLDTPTPNTTIIRTELGLVCSNPPITLNLDNTTLTLQNVSVGNPHAVCLQSVSDHDFHELAPRIATHPIFPNGTNVSFASVTTTHIDLKVWERGAGPTLACGTAAAATAWTALSQHPNLTLPIQVRLPGGSLELSFVDNRATITGEATFVFAGTLPA